MTEPTEPTYIIVQQAPAPEKRRFPRWALAAMGALLLAGAGAGTFASFSASTTNSSTFASGTLVLTDQVDAGSICYSSGTTATDTGVNTDTNDNANCAALFNLTVKKPGDNATANLTLKNDGSIDATALKGFASAACADANETSETYHGTGNLCSTLLLSIQNYGNDSTRTAPASCLYGGASGNVCNNSDATKTIGAFTGAYPDANTTLAMGTLTAGTSRYLTIGINFPSTATNNVQGRKATFGLKWQIVQ
jgi:predicted ribosomally synthesized peptide with SipW-like signal peptide